MVSFKYWNTLKHEYELTKNLYFQEMERISAKLCTCEKLIKQNEDFTTTEHHLINTLDSLQFKQQFKDVALATYNNN